MKICFAVIGIICGLVNGLVPLLRAGEVLKLATTTSTYETGLLDVILPPFEQKCNCQVHVISVGTGKALKLGENGDVDIVLVHARAAEDRFVNAGFGVNRRDVMYNDFVLLGPRNDPAGIAKLRSAAAALKSIPTTGAQFVSRGDESGTHQKEKELWAKSGLAPNGPWYISAGQGMSATLRMADEKNAYVLCDRASYLAAKDQLRIVVLLEGDPDLLNPYGVIAVSPYKYPQIKYAQAMSLIAWLTAPECQALIDGFRKNGAQLYHASAAPAK